MPPTLALVLGYGLIAWLLREDMRWRTAGSRTLFVVAVFLGIIGSRPLSYWLGAGGGGPNGDGNSVNTTFYGIVMAISLFALQARNFDWVGFFERNKTLLLLYFFFAISALWSVDAALSIRRLVKDFSCVLVALVILTEQEPAHALRTLFVRVAYILFPLSLVLGKYFPEIGRSFSIGGSQMFTGVTTQKNSLGEILFVFGLILMWDLIELRKGVGWRTQRARVYINFGMLGLGLWLLNACDSKTSLVCLIVSGALLLARARFLRMRNGRAAVIWLLIGSTGLYALDNTLGVSKAILESLNRDPTLTGRTEIWRAVLQQQNEPWLGGGFYMFWDSAKGKAVVKELVTVNSAHSGYVETYLDGGIVGCALLGLFLLAIGWRALNRFFQNAPFAAVGLPFWVGALIYNFSEASFLRLDSLWFVLLLVTIELRRWASEGAAATMDVPDNVTQSTEEVYSLRASSHEISRRGEPTISGALL